MIGSIACCLNNRRDQSVSCISLVGRSRPGTPMVIFYISDHHGSASDYRMFTDIGYSCGQGGADPHKGSFQ